MKIQNVFNDMIYYGTAFTKFGIRKWYNPMRYILGRYYHKHINLRNVFK
jgi:hypothetical protein